MDIHNAHTATNIESLYAQVLEKLGAPKAVGKPSSELEAYPAFDHRVDPEELRLPGLVSETEWNVAELLTQKAEEKVFGGKLSPLNQALLFRTIYVELLQMHIKPN